jgi:hypothetical protein
MLSKNSILPAEKINIDLSDTIKVKLKSTYINNLTIGLQSCVDYCVINISCDKDIMNELYHCCYNGNLRLLRRILRYEQNIISNMDILLLFNNACKYGHVDICSHMLEFYPFLTYSIDFTKMFLNSVKEGHVNMVEWLYINKSMNKLSIDTMNRAFIICCENEYLHIAKWIISLNDVCINIHAENNSAFKSCCENKRLGYISYTAYVHRLKKDIGMVSWLESLSELWSFRVANYEYGGAHVIPIIK